VHYGWKESSTLEGGLIEKGSEESEKLGGAVEYLARGRMQLGRIKHESVGWITEAFRQVHR
jgi:hypothetical protein